MKIRKAGVHDIQAIHELAEKIWWPAYRNVISDEQIRFMLEDMYSEGSLMEQMNGGLEFWLAVRENVPVAFAGYSLTESEKQIYKLHKLYVLPSEQGRGTGTKLIDHISALAKSAGGKILELNVNRGNQAQHFYRKAGFDVFETVDIPYHHFVLNDYVMRKAL